MMKRYGSLFATILILQILAFMTSYFVTQTAVSTWYQNINKAALNPPDWVFAPVWTILYTMLGVALWRLWQKRTDNAGKCALIFFLVQLFGNYCWSPLFFGMAAFGSAFALLLGIIAFTIGAMVMAYKTDKAVPWLLMPYLAWISFASYLNYSVWVLNP